MTGANGQGA